MAKNLEAIKSNLFDLLENKKIVITGGAGFIGGTLIRRLLIESEAKIFNLDKLSYSSDLKSINNLLKNNEEKNNRYKFYKIDLFNQKELLEIICNIKPDIVMHLAAESHVDRSIDNANLFIKSNVLGTYNLLEAVKNYYSSLSNNRKNKFIFHHISTDEVFGTLGDKGQFNEKTKYDPRSPYSASKAASDHLVRSWHHTFGIPCLITNCSNNYGPWQFPDKLIPVIILNALNQNKIPIYGDGQQIRDWLFVEDHIDALLLIASKGEIGDTYCIGGDNERTNNEVAKLICSILDNLKPISKPYSDFITYVSDRPGHDLRYAIDASFLKKKLKWFPKQGFRSGLELTVKWYLENMKWTESVLN